jgi:hypothetical protein
MPLTSVIACQSRRAYFAPMATITRLLTLMALVLMPFGMGSASAGAAHHAPAATAASHCDGHGEQPAAPVPDDAIDCAMTCSMLIVAQARIPDPVPVGGPLAQGAVAESATGLHPNPATPPPKRS